MKFILTLLLLFTFLDCRADAWDNLTKEEAESVCSFLKEHPFVFDYCDCCDKKDDDIFIVRLLKITQTRIVECSWNADFFSVEYDCQMIAELTYQDDGSKVVAAPPYEKERQQLIYMNYTWGFNSDSKLAQPLFDIVEYHYYEGELCKPPFAFPDPSTLKELKKTKSYKKWWKREISV